ncbi:hypothetical protein NQZ68_013982 [Dissostichus eleginoides]|nr:hypothetical protein NQZ68_013982 [Dissostichus eleginoides]
MSSSNICSAPYRNLRTSTKQNGPTSSWSGTLPLPPLHHSGFSSPEKPTLDGENVDERSYALDRKPPVLAHRERGERREASSSADLECYHGPINIWGPDDEQPSADPQNHC